MKVFKWLGLGVAAIGTIDLLWGNTNAIPSWDSTVGHYLNQQIDAVLLIGGVIVFMYAK